MGFYFLHDDRITKPTDSDFKYIYYTKKDINFTTRVSLKKEPDVKYCIHEMMGKFDSWSVDDSIITLTTHENMIKETYEKIHNSDNFELWLNKRHIEVGNSL